MSDWAKQNVRRLLAELDIEKSAGTIPVQPGTAGRSPSRSLGKPRSRSAANRLSEELRFAG